MNVKINVQKKRDGWQAKSRIKLPTGRFLEVHTWKTSAGIATHYQECDVEQIDGGHEVVRFTMFEDPSGYLKKFPGKRATQKAITECHKESLRTLPQFLADKYDMYA